MPSPSPNFLYPYYPSAQRFEDGKISYNREVLGNDVKGIMDARRQNDPAAYPSSPSVVTIYFVNQFIADRKGNSTCKPPAALNQEIQNLPPTDSSGNPIHYYPDCDTAGRAVTSTETLKVMTSLPSGFVDESPNYLSSAFITTLSLGNKQVADGKTVAHELAHVVLSSDDNPDGTVVNILTGYKQPALTVTQKRFNGTQIGVIRANNQIFAPVK